MRVMIKLSLLLNIAVLAPICVGLISDSNWIAESYGHFTTARGILFSVYLSIGLVSALLLFFYFLVVAIIFGRFWLAFATAATDTFIRLG